MTQKTEQVDAYLSNLTPDRRAALESIGRRPCSHPFFSPEA
jgi:hypothetical protein